ncbi:response regulator transcription factor [Streptomyces sp. R302]|uniref:response regulator n=1 Tax=unclassified Streptomyces TaxID=2593676 RepID=UPI00145FA602|nr:MULTISPECIES: response regulator transcription factor [unclassified Streptomyces]NML51894.1 response regulator transcription factor [Streptomyces sp. R301]NML81514.1 response regulator transcription factor [Streptomyces sp. R302]
MSDTTDPAPRPVRVVLADDQPLVRTALRMVMAETEDLLVAGEASDGAEAVRLVEETGADVVVMDLRMPGTDGIEATRRITAGRSGARVVVLTTFDDDDHVYGALHAGASGFLVKDMAMDEILAAVRVVASGDALIAPAVTGRLIKEFTRRPRDGRAAAPDGPTPAARHVAGRTTEREREVLTLVGRGLSNAEIAEELHITLATVKTYVTRLLAKLDARDRVHLVILAYEAGLVATGASASPGRVDG